MSGQNRPDVTGTPKRRLRVAYLMVQPVLVWDDGEDLAPGPDIGPSEVALPRLFDWLEGVRAEVAAYPDPESDSPDVE